MSKQGMDSSNNFSLSIEYNTSGPWSTHATNIALVADDEMDMVILRPTDDEIDDIVTVLLYYKMLRSGKVNV